MQICPARFVSLRINLLFRKGKYAVGEIVVCSILTKHMD